MSKEADLATRVAGKCVVSFGVEFCSSTQLCDNWFARFSELLYDSQFFLRMCWLKSVAGAWCTSIRMNAAHRLSCLFGCIDCKDTFLHYIECPILWQIIMEAIGPLESITVASRMGFHDFSMLQLQSLSLAHLIYHHVKNDPSCVSLDRVAPSSTVQASAARFARYAIHLVTP